MYIQYLRVLAAMKCTETNETQTEDTEIRTNFKTNTLDELSGVVRNGFVPNVISSRPEATRLC